MVSKSHKKCPRGNETKPKSDFIDATGSNNTKGKYCSKCYKEREKESFLEILEDEKISTLRKLKIVYGDDWPKFTFPHELQYTLWSERDFCLYCGRTFPLSPYKESFSIDHMEPLDKGGEDSYRNSVYCCNSCNSKKGKNLFIDWLDKLKPEYQKISLGVYVSKLDYHPKKYLPGLPTSRLGDGMRAWLLLDDDEIKELIEEVGRDYL